MEITEVRVKLVSGKNDKLRAFCSITIDNDFVVRDLKVIDGVKGPFVAMPSRKIMERCSRCGGKNHYRARFCNDCGNQLQRNGGRGRAGGSEEGEGHERSRFHAEIAHPINSRCREVIQRKVLEKFEEELVRSKVPGYRADFESDEYDDDYFEERGGREAASRVPETPGEAREEDRPFARPAFDDPRLDKTSATHTEEPGEPRRRVHEDDGEEQPPAAARETRPREEAERPSERQPKREREPAREQDLEPEDNFGAGIFP